MTFTLSLVRFRRGRIRWGESYWLRRSHRELTGKILSARGTWLCQHDRPNTPRKHTSTIFVVISSWRRPHRASTQQRDREDEDLPGCKKSRAPLGHCGENSVTAEALTAGGPGDRQLCAIPRGACSTGVPWTKGHLMKTGSVHRGMILVDGDIRVMQGVGRARWVGGKAVVLWVKAYELLDSRVVAGKMSLLKAFRKLNMISGGLESRLH
ncbi:hypothetical protein JB92DRAFT_3101673 [Gautieria morchelliformis]|nr:hypothetical protein JB92DRAFT_3101673 [Gautieria morchelliformis]